MAVELVYISKAGTRSYWTTTHHFAKGEADHYLWPTDLDLIGDFNALSEKYPTIFRPKNQRRFFVNHTDTAEMRPLEAGEESTNQQAAESRPAFVELSLSHSVQKKVNKDHKYYAVALIKADNFLFLDTTMNAVGGWRKKITADVRRWNAVEKAVDTANLFRNNQVFCKAHPTMDPEQIVVIDVRTGQVVWSFSSSASTQPAKLDDFQLAWQLQQVKARLEGHFTPESFSELSVDDRTKQAPSLDFDQFNGPRF